MEQIAVHLLRLIRQGGGAGPDGGQHTFDEEFRQGQLGQVAQRAQTHGQKYRKDQHNLHFSGNIVFHNDSLNSSGASSRRIVPSLHTGRPTTL